MNAEKSHQQAGLTAFDIDNAARTIDRSGHFGVERCEGRSRFWRRYGYA